MPVSGSLTHKGNCSGTQKTEPDPPTADKPTHGTRHSLQTKKQQDILFRIPAYFNQNERLFYLRFRFFSYFCV